jgi:hypothetical protein
MTENKLIAAIKQNLSPELLPADFSPPSWVGPYAGYCYMASEAFWHLTGRVYKPCQMLVRSLSSHWYLQCRDSGRVIDITAEQFPFFLEYSEGIERGFRTREPSKPAQIVIDRVRGLTGEG